MEFKGLAVLLFAQRQMLWLGGTKLPEEKRILPKFKDFVFYEDGLEKQESEKMAWDILSSAVKDNLISIDNWDDSLVPEESLRYKLNIKQGERFRVLKKVYKIRLRMVRNGAYRKTNEDYRYDVQVASLFADVGKPYLEGKHISPVSIYVSGENKPEWFDGLSILLALEDEVSDLRAFRFSRIEDDCAVVQMSQDFIKANIVPMCITTPEEDGGEVQNTREPLARRWEDVEIKFTDENNIEIWINNSKHTRGDFETLGLRKHTDKAWVMLRQLSFIGTEVEDGNPIRIGIDNLVRLPEFNSASDPRNLVQKYKSELSKHLKNYFGLETEPIIYNEVHGYVPLFQLTPEADMRSTYIRPESAGLIDEF